MSFAMQVKLFGSYFQKIRMTIYEAELVVKEKPFKAMPHLLLKNKLL